MGRLLTPDEIERIVASKGWAEAAQKARLDKAVPLDQLWQKGMEAAMLGYPSELNPAQALSPLGLKGFRAAIVDLEGTLGALRALREGKTLLGRIWAALAARRTIASENDLQEFFRTIPLAIASASTLRSIGLRVRGNASTGYVIVPLYAPLPEGIRRRVSADEQDLPYILNPMPGAGIAKPAETVVQLKNAVIDLRPLMALVHTTLGSPNLRQGVAGLDAWSSLLQKGTVHRLVSVVVEYLEGLVKVDPILGRKRRVALVFGRDVYGAPPRYLVARSVSIDTTLYSPEGILLSANVEMEFGEYWDANWEG